jgi:RND family efflux transporter MFP subunit
MVAMEMVVAQVVMGEERPMAVRDREGWPMRRGARGARVLLAAAAALGSACRSNRYEPPPPPEVTVSRPVAQEVTTYSEFSGHTVAVEAVDVRARVQGYLKSINFTSGTDVKQGDLLFVIEPDLYQARVDEAQADLEGKEAQYRAAQAQLEITQAIFERSAGSRTDVVQKTQQRDLAKAQVAIARATLDAARLDLSYTHIYAPISGRIDRNLVDVGNLVGAGEATLLTSIVRPDPIYAYFTTSERQLLQFRELQREKRTVAPAGQHNVAYLALATDTGFPHVGKVDYSGNTVDPDTGTIEVRAVFPNPDRVILPGLFARVRLPFTRERALLVPEVAVSADQGGEYLLAVDDKNVVQYRRVHVGPTVDGSLRVVQDGIGAEDWVIVNGLQRARPGSAVHPTRTETTAPEPVPPTAGSPSEP